MTWAANVWTSRRARILAIAVLFYLVWKAWLLVHAPGKIAPEVRQRVSPRGTVDLLVTLPFPPERFHILVFQRYGRVSGTSGNTAEVRSVKLEEVTGLARYYWVRRVAPIPNDRHPASPG